MYQDEWQGGGAVIGTMVVERNELSDVVTRDYNDGALKNDL